MSPTRKFQCIVDDTALITNISEIESWVSRGAVSLVIPLHTLERLHLLKKDTSQIGQNARKAVKFLDEVTSNIETADQIIIQGPDDGYPTWNQVETHYIENQVESGIEKLGEDTIKVFGEELRKENTTRGGRVCDEKTILQDLQTKLNVSKATQGTSPLSTPPLSPSSSAPQSSKNSPEVKLATIIANDASPVPQTLKPLLNPVVWYTHEKKTNSPKNNLVFLTNSSDTSYLARDFGVVSKNIHQLRAAIGMEDQEAKNRDKYQKKHGHSPKPSNEPKTLFKYEDGDSEEEEEVVFKPRGRGAPRGSAAANRGGNNGSVRSRRSHGHSPANSMSVPAATTAAAAAIPQTKPQIPTEEIDPDSFDRGSFARGSTPLVSIGNSNTGQSAQNHNNNNNNSNNNGNSNYNRGQSSRNNVAASSGSSRGYYRGSSRGGFDRGAARGRGRLFVP